MGREKKNIFSNKSAFYHIEIQSLKITKSYFKKKRVFLHKFSFSVLPYHQLKSSKKEILLSKLFFVLNENITQIRVWQFYTTRISININFI